jgi:hypothetical protein
MAEPITTDQDIAATAASSTSYDKLEAKSTEQVASNGSIVQEKDEKTYLLESERKDKDVSFTIIHVISYYLINFSL